MSKVVFGSGKNSFITNLSDLKDNYYIKHINTASFNPDITELLGIIKEDLCVESTNFFRLLSSKQIINPNEVKTLDKNPIKKWANKFKLCDIKLRAEQLNSVCLLLNLQANLAADSLSALEQYLTATNIDFEKALTNYSQLKLDHLLQTSDKTNLVHHVFARKLEITSHIRQMITNLSLLPTDNKASDCLMQLIDIIIQFDDNLSAGHAVTDSEKPTLANELANSLINALSIQANPNNSDFDAVSQLIHFITHLIIVGGTSLIQSKKRVMGLMEVLFMLEEDSSRLGMLFTSESNQSLVNTLKIIAVLRGIYDKTPSSSFDIVAEQSKALIQETRPSIKQYIEGISVLEAFFKSPLFKPYFGISQELIPINQQAFLMMISAQLLTSTTSNLSGYEEEPRQEIVKFIALCRSNIKNVQFKSDYNQLFAKYDIEQTISKLLFAQIEEKVKVNYSQIDGLRYMTTRLILMGLSHRSLTGLTTCGNFQQMFNSDVPKQDAENLKALYQFYCNLTHEEKNNLIKELLMTVIIQTKGIESPSLGLGNHLKPLRQSNPNSIVLQQHRPNKNSLFESNAENKREPGRFDRTSLSMLGAYLTKN